MLWFFLSWKSWGDIQFLFLVHLLCNYIVGWKKVTHSKCVITELWIFGSDLYIHNLCQLTYWSSCFSRVDKDSMHDSSEVSCGSIFPHSRDTTVMEECSVSLWTWDPCSRINVNTQFKPPDSKTDPDSLVQMNSNTWKIPHSNSIILVYSFKIQDYYT